jgi:hypothetical protein
MGAERLKEDDSGGGVGIVDSGGSSGNDGGGGSTLSFVSSLQRAPPPQRYVDVIADGFAAVKAPAAAVRRLLRNDTVARVTVRRSVSLLYLWHTCFICSFSTFRASQSQCSCERPFSVATLATANLTNSLQTLRCRHRKDVGFLLQRSLSCEQHRKQLWRRSQ